MRHYPSIKERSVSLIINVSIVYSLYVSLTGNWLPTGGIETIWLVSAVSFWFLNLLSAPWFVPPRDALISSIGSFLILSSMELSLLHPFLTELSQLRGVFIVYAIVVSLAALLALFLHDKDERSPAGRFIFKLAGVFGKGEILFSGPALLSIVGVYHSSPIQMIWLALLWVLITVVKPVESLIAAWQSYRKEKNQQTSQPTVGSISRIDHPDIVRVRLSSANSWHVNRLYTACMPDNQQKFVVSLFSQVQGTDVIGTGLCVGVSGEPISLPSGFVCASHDEEKTKAFLEKLSGAKEAKLVGFVVEKSNIGLISFEVAAHSDLKEGDVVFVRIQAQDVFYQIVGAETVEESFDQNPRGTHVVTASQLGVYNSSVGFIKYQWLPAMNTPIFSAGSRQFDPPVIGEREFEIGKVPSTNISAIANVDDLVEFHTAILGVTGTGKTEVALDLVRQAAERGVKIFCVDFTGDYRARLADLNPIYPSPDGNKAKSIEGLLATIDAYGFKAGDERRKLTEILTATREETNKVIDDFMRNPDTNVAIFELADISNSKAGLRLTEIYLSAIMNWARANRKAKQVFLCLEEAHTIVPEAFGSGFDGETKWVVERIGQIALQGRKYGVGLLVVTQRTALVSKTILSQCNTFLTHSLIDQTSLNFLESVYSSQHTRLIPNLGRFEFLAFGKAINAERPMILKREFSQAIEDASNALHRPLPEAPSESNDQGAAIEQNNDAITE